MKPLKYFSLFFLLIGILLIVIRQFGGFIFFASGAILQIIYQLILMISHIKKKSYYTATKRLLLSLSLITFTLGLLYWPQIRLYTIVPLIACGFVLIILSVKTNEVKKEQFNMTNTILTVSLLLNFIPYYLLVEYIQLSLMPNDLAPEDICARTDRYVAEINKIERYDLLAKYVDLIKENCSNSDLKLEELKSLKRKFTIKVISGDFEIMNKTTVQVNVEPFDPSTETLLLIPGNNCLYNNKNGINGIIPLDGTLVTIYLVIRNQENEYFAIGSKNFDIKN